MKKLDPFQVEPLPKAFYHPTKEKELSKKEKKVCLSAPAIPQHQQVTSPEDLQFLKDVSALKIQEIPTRENGSFADQSSSSQFNESWPSSTEQTGSLGTPVSDSTLASPEMSQQMREWLTGQDAKPATKSTLGWYINRFRNAPPASRQRRDKSSFTNQKQGDFWWLSPPNGQSSPVLQDTPPQKLKPSPPPKGPPKKTSKPPVSTSTPRSLQTNDISIDEINRRAKELLERSETSTDSISTEPFPLPLKKPSMTRTKTTDTTSTSSIARAAFTPDITRTTTTTTTTRQNPWPEDDILYQWRLSRKMEKAQERVSTIRPVGPSSGAPRLQTNYDRIGQVSSLRPLLGYDQTGLKHLHDNAGQDLNQRLLNTHNGIGQQNSHGNLHIPGISQSLSDHCDHIGKTSVQSHDIFPKGDPHSHRTNSHLDQIGPGGSYDNTDDPTQRLLSTEQVGPTGSNDNIQRISTCVHLPQGQGHTELHSQQQYTPSGQTRPVTMTTSESYVPVCSSSSPGVKSSDGRSITTSNTQYTTTLHCIMTPIVSPPCQHESTSNHTAVSPGIHPHMHLACDIIPCPCSDSPAKTKSKVGIGNIDSQRQVDQDEFISSEEEKENQYPNKKKHFNMQEQRRSQSKKNYPNSFKKTSDEHHANTLPDERTSEKTGIVHKTKTLLDESKANTDKRDFERRRNNLKDPLNDKRPVAHTSSDESVSKKSVHKMKGKSMKKTSKASDIVDNIIGKVVSEHLFFGDSTTSDDENSYRTSTELPLQQLTTNHQVVTCLPHEGLLVESSEEEFPEDEILKMLRQRSRDLKTKLGAIDQYLLNNQ